MTTDQIISKELPLQLHNALCDGCSVTFKLAKAEFQQAQLHAINRFIEALYALSNGDEVVETIKYLEAQLNEQAKR
jgi:hypothetical protein